MLSLTNVMHLSKDQYSLIKVLCKCSKNLYNLGLYNTRQSFFNDNIFLQYPKNYHLCKHSENYKMLQANVAQQSLKYVERNARSFFELLKLHKQGKVNQPSMPHYLGQNELFLVVYPNKSFSIRDGKVYLGASRKIKEIFPNARELLTFKLPKPLEDKHIREIHILPIYNGLFFKMQFIYDSEREIYDLNQNKYLSIDLGLNNFATYIDNSTGTATIIDGKYLKSINQWYNKENARLQSIKDKQHFEYYTERQYKLLWKRSNITNEFMNRAVFQIINHCIVNDIGNVLIGEMKNIKHNSRLGKKNNQSFVQIPYNKFKLKLQTKCEHYGIKYRLVNEAYTSQVDALAFDEIKKQPYGKTRRVSRGLYQSATGTLINADVNGALNILRKVAGDSPAREIVSSGLVSRPKRIRLAYEQPSLESI